LNQIRNYRVVVSTVANANHLVAIGVPKGFFNYIIIDEAAQMTEPLVLIPLQLASNSFFSKDESANDKLQDDKVVKKDPPPVPKKTYHDHPGWRSFAAWTTCLFCGCQKT